MLLAPGCPPVAPEFLGEVPLFHTLSVGELDRLAACFTGVAFARGDTIFSVGDPADALYVVLEGAVTLCRGPWGEKVRALARLGRGDFFGEMGLFGDGRHSKTARATRPSTVLRIGREGLFEFLEDHPVIALKLEMAAARGHSTKAASALATAERRTERTRVRQKVTLKTADGSSIKAMLIDISMAGLNLAGVPVAWRPEQWLSFHLLWGSHILRFYGRVAGRSEANAGIELMDRSPDRDAWIKRVVEKMVIRSIPSGGSRGVSSVPSGGSKGDCSSA